MQGDNLSWFWLAFPWWLKMLSVFSGAPWPFACLFEKNVYSGSLLIFLIRVFVAVCFFFFFLMLSCMHYFYIFNIHSLSYITVANIFTHAVDSLFVWLTILTVQNLLVWCSLICFFFLLFPFPEGKYPKSIAKTNIKELLSMFSSSAFMFLRTTNKSLINFVFIFVCGMRKWPSLIVLHVTVQFPKQIEKTIVSPLHILASFVVELPV